MEQICNSLRIPELNLSHTVELLVPCVPDFEIAGFQLAVVAVVVVVVVVVDVAAAEDAVEVGLLVDHVKWE
jgi:hypothetical protein